MWKGRTRRAIAVAASLVFAAGTAAAATAPASARWGRSNSAYAVDVLDPAFPDTDSRTCRDGIRFGLAVLADFPDPSITFRPQASEVDSGSTPIREVLPAEDVAVPKLAAPVTIYNANQDSDADAYFLAYYDRHWNVAGAPATLEPGTPVRFEGDPPGDAPEGGTTVVQDCYLFGTPPPVADSVSVEVGGRRPYDNSGSLTGGNLAVTADAKGMAAVHGRGTLPGTAGGDATISLDVGQLVHGRLAIGVVSIVDPGAGARHVGIFVGRLGIGPAGTATGTGLLVGRSGGPISFTVTDAI